MINIMMSLDDNNISGLLATINSILKNTQSDIKFHILIFENSKFYYDLIYKYFPHINVQIKEFKNYSNYANFLNDNINVSDKKFQYISNIMNFARFYLPQIFDDVNIAVYLDTDVIVQHDIITILDHIDLDNFYIAASINRELSEMKFDESLNMIGKGFNTGVYVLNCDYWKRAKLTTRCEYIMIQHKQRILFKLGTQPILNIIFYKMCTDISKKWNYTGLGSKIMNKSKMDTAYILHWTGPNKPWLETGLNKEYWIKYDLVLASNCTNQSIPQIN